VPCSGIRAASVSHPAACRVLSRGVVPVSRPCRIPWHGVRVVSHGTASMSHSDTVSVPHPAAPRPSHPCRSPPRRVRVAARRAASQPAASARVDAVAAHAQRGSEMSPHPTRSTQRDPGDGRRAARPRPASPTISSRVGSPARLLPRMVGARRCWSACGGWSATPTPAWPRGATAATVGSARARRRQPRRQQGRHRNDAVAGQRRLILRIFDPP